MNYSRLLPSVLLLAAAGVAAASQRAGEPAGTGSPAVGSGDTWTDWLDGINYDDLPDDTTNTGSTGGDMNQPRGIRNNNPGNIEYTGTQWQGLADPPSDGRYMRFVAPKWGIRAMARVLETYVNSYGINTVGGIIARWAPDHENPTNAYAEFVANALGVGVTQPIDVLGQRPGLIAAMIEFENGQQPYSMSEIRQGVALA